MKTLTQKIKRVLLTPIKPEHIKQVIQVLYYLIAILKLWE